jgi:hypothetical protein
VGIPAAPSNFWVQSGSSQAYLSWDISAGATSYSVQRSTDGVTYAVVATPSVTSYSDTSVTVNTEYWYKVASVNSSGTSVYTSTQTAIATLPGKSSLGALRLAAQQRSDMVNAHFIELPEWNFFINQSYYELYDLLITAYEDYYVAPALVFSTDGSSQYNLPNGANYSSAPAFYKMYGVDCGLSNNNNAWITLKKFDFIERNRFIYPQLNSTVLGVFNLKYRVIGDKLMFIPTPSSGQYIRLWYYPRLAVLLADTDVMDGISGWDQYVIIRTAKYALDKEESDTSKLDAELVYLKSRIEESASNRDAGQPDRISPTRSWSESYGMGGMGIDGSSGGY